MNANRGGRRQIRAYHRERVVGLYLLSSVLQVPHLVSFIAFRLNKSPLIVITSHIMISLSKLRELEEARRELKRRACKLQSDIRRAKRHRSKLLEKARNLSKSDLTDLLAEKDLREKELRDARALQQTPNLEQPPKQPPTEQPALKEKHLISEPPTYPKESMVPPPMQKASEKKDQVPSPNEEDGDD